MKKRYPIDKQRAVQQFRQLANQDDQAVQLVIPLKKRRSMRMVPFETTGSYGNTTVGIDWKKDLARLK